MSTIRLIWPQWHGGVNPNYVLGSQLLALIAPSCADHETIEVAVDMDFEAIERLDGIDCGKALLEEHAEVRRMLEGRNPDRVIVLGGDCSVSQVPFDYLSGRYGDGLGILWLDAHPDISGRDSSHHLHEMPVADLVGLGGDSELTRVDNPVPPARVMYAGLIEEDLRPMDMACKRLGIRVVGPQRLIQTSEDVLSWVAEEGITHVAVHWDLDVLNPEGFRSIYPAEPGTLVEEFPAAVGRMGLADVGRLIADVSQRARIVGLTIAEHLPWDALNLRRTLEGIDIFS